MDYNENNLKHNYNQNEEISILVVEDSETQVIELQYILEKENYHVQTVTNGLEAMKYLENNRATLIISDVMMPGMNGYNLCKKIKSDENLKSIPVILLTQLSDPVDILRGLEAGADNFITKPYREEFLLSCVHHLLVNVELRKTRLSSMGIELVFKGEKYFITSERFQMLDLLLSSYETAVDHYISLEKVNNEVKRLNLKLLEQAQQIKMLSLIDNLTGLYNRNGFLILVEHEINIANRRKEKRILFFINLDNIEEINNNLGYQKGDGLLVDAANLIKNTLRKTEIIARIGGQEFVIFFTDTSPDYANRFIDRILNAVEKYNTVENHNYTLSLSFGTAIYNPEEPCSGDELIDIVDKKLHKKIGKGM